VGAAEQGIVGTCRPQPRPRRSPLVLPAASPPGPSQRPPGPSAVSSPPAAVGRRCGEPGAGHAGGARGSVLELGAAAGRCLAAHAHRDGGGARLGRAVLLVPVGVRVGADGRVPRRGARLGRRGAGAARRGGHDRQLDARGAQRASAQRWRPATSSSAPSSPAACQRARFGQGRVLAVLASGAVGPAGPRPVGPAARLAAPGGSARSLALRCARRHGQGAVDGARVPPAGSPRCG
jgi:hypothetical protein